MLVCDQCGQEFDDGERAWFHDIRRARRAAKRQGWYRYVEGQWPGPNNKDLCPACAEKFVQEKATATP